MHEREYFNPNSLLFPYSLLGDSIVKSSEGGNGLVVEEEEEAEGTGSARSGLCYYKCKCKQNLGVKISLQKQ